MHDLGLRQGLRMGVRGAKPSGAANREKSPAVARELASTASACSDSTANQRA